MEQEKEIVRPINLPGSRGEHRAQQINGTARKALAFYNKQMLNYLNPLMRQFIGEQDMVFIATADGMGECDCSFRAGLLGYLRLLDDKTLVYPEYRGNGVLASIGNIFENPHVGMIFIDFQRMLGLHVNGKASVVESEHLVQKLGSGSDLLAQTSVKSGRQPERWILMHVEEAYIHCSKHIPLYQKIDREIDWGTDDDYKKGGDAFGAKACPRPWNRECEEV